MDKKVIRILFSFLMFITISRSFGAPSFPMALKSSCFIDEKSHEATTFDPLYDEQLVEYEKQFAVYLKQVQKSPKNPPRRAPVPPVSKISDEKLPIASVSKIFTALMATTKFQLGKAPFATQFFIQEVSPGRFNVHIKGSNDPYFNKYKMHQAISMLNKFGISTVELLTFDENVKFLSDTDSKGGFWSAGKAITPLTLKAEIDFPTPDVVKPQFQEFWKLTREYSDTFKAANSVHLKGIVMVNNPKFSVKKVEFLSSRDFTQVNARSFYVESQQMSTMLKMMNWNSNNYSANRIYAAAGGESYFRELFYTNYKNTEANLTFVNGSGQNHNLNGGEDRIYNQATCSAVVKAIRALNKTVVGQRKKLTDVMSVVGLDVDSTVGGKVYSNELTTGKVVAKTGTVCTNVTLAGAINTAAGYRFFMFNVDLGSASRTASDAVCTTLAVRGRKIISEQLNALVEATAKTFEVIPLAYKSNAALFKQYGFENYDEDLAEGPKPPPIRFSLKTAVRIQ